MKKHDEQSKGSRDRRTLVWGMLALFVFTLASYAPALRAGFIWDDDDYVTENRTLRDVGGLRAMWTEKGAIPQYYPLTHTTFWIEYQTWSLWAPGYHATNILLHALTAFFLWRLLRRLHLTGAWWIALFFALHPVHVESVAWITERKNVLSGALYLAAFLVYWRAYEASHGRVRIASRQYVIAYLLFVGALLSKTVTCSLPAALLLTIWWKKGRLDKACILPTLPFFGIGLFMAWITVHVERTVVLAVGHEWDLSFIDRGLIAGRALWFYIAKLVWPVQLTFFYPRWSIDSASPAAYLYPGAFAALLVALWLARERLGRGPLVALLFFAGTLSPALGFFDVYPMRYSFVADHFQYLASIGILALVAGGSFRCVAHRLGLRRLLEVCFAAIALLLAWLTWQQAHTYKDLETLWRTTIERNPTAWAAHNNLGLLLHLRGEANTAFAHYQAAYAIREDAPEVLVNIGFWHAEQGNADEALHWYERALAIREDYPDAYFNMGNVHLHAGRYGEAARLYEQALRWRSQDPRILANLAQAHFRLGAPGRAEHLYRQVLALDPGSADDHMNLGIVRAAQGQHTEAIEAFRQALILQPAHSRAALRAVGSHLALGDYDAARRLVEQFIVHAQGDADMHVTLGDLHARQGAEQGALEQYRMALALASEHVLALNNLAWLLATSANDSLRDGAAALDAARRANELMGFGQPVLLNTLAAAHAEQGDYAEARRLMHNALEHPSLSEQQRADYLKRLKLYEAEQPYRRTAPPSS